MILPDLLTTLSNPQSTILFKPVHEVVFPCPTCDQPLFRQSLSSVHEPITRNLSSKYQVQYSRRIKDKQLNTHKTQDYLFINGDVVDLPITHQSSVDAVMLYGRCAKCTGSISDLNLTILHQDLKDLYIDNTHRVFMVTSPNELIAHCKDVKLFGLYLNDSLMGYMEEYIDAHLDNTALLTSLSNTKQPRVNTIHLMSDVMSINTESRNGNTVNNHYGSQNQKNVWDMASTVSELIIAQFNTYKKSS